MHADDYSAVLIQASRPSRGRPGPTGRARVRAVGRHVGGALWEDLKMGTHHLYALEADRARHRRRVDDPLHPPLRLDDARRAQGVPARGTRRGGRLGRGTTRGLAGVTRFARRAPGEHRDSPPARDLRHAGAGGDRRRPDVREQHHARRREQLRVHLGLALEDVDPRREDRAGGAARRRGPPRRPPGRARCSRGRRADRIAASSARPMRPRVASVSGTWIDTMSASASSRWSCATQPGSPVSVRVWCRTLMPKPVARRATARPIRP